ncbi:MAG: phosphotransferase [Alphaproteobacteria bacterium]|nr:phosphotransferase [Alphaproteobacteria bacterium]
MPARSASNEVWVGPGIVLRINPSGEVGRLAREARLAARLHPDVRYPEVLDGGVVEVPDGAVEYAVTRRVAGRPLAWAWAGMSREEREAAVSAVLDALDHLHETPAEGLPTDADLDPPHQLPLGSLLRELEEARAGQPANALALLDEVVDWVRERYARVEPERTVVAHGDAHLENVLWDGEVTALLDLEWSRSTWREVDVETLLAFSAMPAGFVAEGVDVDAFGDVASWVRQRRPGWFAEDAVSERLALLHISRTSTLLPGSPATWDPADPADRRTHLRWALDHTGPLFA